MLTVEFRQLNLEKRNALFSESLFFVGGGQASDVALLFLASVDSPRNIGKVFPNIFEVFGDEIQCRSRRGRRRGRRRAWGRRRRSGIAQHIQGSRFDLHRAIATDWTGDHPLGTLLFERGNVIEPSFEGVPLGAFQIIYYHPL